MTRTQLKTALDYWNCVPRGLSNNGRKFFGVILKAACLYEAELKKKSKKKKRVNTANQRDKGD